MAGSILPAYCLVCLHAVGFAAEDETTTIFSLPSVEVVDEVYDHLLRPLVDVPEATEFDFNACRDIFLKYSTESELKADSLYLKAQTMERQDKTEAIRLYKEASEMGQAHAAYRLAQIYNNGMKNDCDPAYQYYEKAGHLGLPAALYIAATHKQSKPQKFIDYIRQASSVNYLPAVEYLTQEAIDDYRNLYRENLRVKTKLNRARDKAYSMVKRATELGSSKSKHFQQQLDKLK